MSQEIFKQKVGVHDFYSYSKKIGRKIAAKAGFCGLNSTYLQTHHQLFWSVPQYGRFNSIYLQALHQLS
jgi:hypothetical protein